MKITTASVFALAIAGQAMASNFIQSCEADSVTVSGHFVTAKCKTIGGTYACSKLDLNNCIKNSYGTLQSDSTGSGPHIGDQCYNCSNDKTSGGVLVDNPTLIHCQCDPKTGAARANWPTAIFDINTIIDNNNGKLQCYGQRATNC